MAEFASWLSEFNTDLIEIMFGLLSAFLMISVIGMLVVGAIAGTLFAVGFLWPLVGRDVWKLITKKEAKKNG